MPYKDKAQQLESQRRHYRGKSKYYMQKAKVRQKRIYLQVQDYKVERGCKLCDEDHPACLEFHHRDPEQKEVNIFATIGKGWSFERILIEIAKCDVLCSNCHRKEHWSGVEQSGSSQGS